MILNFGAKEPESASDNKRLNASSSISNFSSFQKPLVEIAAEQKHVNYHLCLFHYQLLRILYLIAKYDMKSVRPYAFFDTKVKSLKTYILILL
jgi:hypothetical protein